MSLEKLEKKIQERKEVGTEIKASEGVFCADEIIAEIQKNYRLINNTTTRIEKQLQYIEHKINKILETIKYKDLDSDKAREIAELEERLKELKGGE